MGCNGYLVKFRHPVPGSSTRDTAYELPQQARESSHLFHITWAWCSSTPQKVVALSQPCCFYSARDPGLRWCGREERVRPTRSLATIFIRRSYGSSRWNRRCLVFWSSDTPAFGFSVFDRLHHGAGTVPVDSGSHGTERSWPLLST